MPAGNPGAYRDPLTGRFAKRPSIHAGSPLVGRDPKTGRFTPAFVPPPTATSATRRPGPLAEMLTPGFQMRRASIGMDVLSGPARMVGRGVAAVGRGVGRMGGDMMSGIKSRLAASQQRRSGFTGGMFRGIGSAMSMFTNAGEAWKNAGVRGERSARAFFEQTWEKGLVQKAPRRFAKAGGMTTRTAGMQLDAAAKRRVMKASGFEGPASGFLDYTRSKSTEDLMGWVKTAAQGRGGRSTTGAVLKSLRGGMRGRSMAIGSRAGMIVGAGLGMAGASHVGGGLLPTAAAMGAYVGISRIPGLRTPTGGVSMRGRFLGALGAAGANWLLGGTLRKGVDREQVMNTGRDIRYGMREGRHMLGLQ